MKLHGDRTAPVLFSIFLITLLPVPCLAQVETPSESSASIDPEPDVDSEDLAGGDGFDGESASGPSLDVEEIVVTGERVEGHQEDPISATHFGTDELRNLRIQNVADVADYTPNLEINTSFAASNPTLFIRGVGLKDYNSNSAGAVAVWHDGIQMNSPSAQLFSIFDIESVDVLRGPIGGLGGRNATAGAIRLNSFKPSLDWTSQASFSFGNLNLKEFEGALGFPILPDTLGGTLSGRLSTAFGFRDGYVNNVCSNWDPPAYGFLEATEAGTRESYESLVPHDRNDNPEGYTGDQRFRFIYKDAAAVEAYNSFPSVTPIKLIPSIEGDGLPPGSMVGQQGIGVFKNPPDDVCILGSEGFLQTGRSATLRKPEGTWTPQAGAKPLSDFQGLQDTYNDVEYYAARFQLLAEPAESWDILVNFHRGWNRGDSAHLQSVGVEAVTAESDEVITEPLGFFQGGAAAWSELSASAIVPFENPERRPGLFGTKAEEGGKANKAPGFATDDHRSGFYSSDGIEKLDLWGTSASVAYEPEWGRFLSITGYEWNRRDIEDEGDASPTTELEALYEDEAWQITQDLRLEYARDRFDVTLGAFFIHEELTSRNLFLSSIRFNTDQTYEQSLNGWNIGADLHYDFLEDSSWRWLYQISFDGGFRYNWEQKNFTLESKSRSTANQVERTALEKDTAQGSWNAPTGEATLSYLPFENARIYGKYTHGYKAGHFNAGLTIEPSPEGRQGDEEAKQSIDPVAPEIINAIEFGVKWNGFDGRLDLAGALFRYWYTDLQVFDIVNEAGAIPTQQLLNANAKVLGAELELSVRPLEGLLLSGGMGWLNTKFGNFEVEKRVFQRGGTPGGGAGGDTAIFNYKGNPLIAAPRWSASGYVEYELPLGRWGSLVPIFDFWYKSQVYLDPQKEELISQEPVWIFNARLAYRIPIRGFEVEVAGWVRNFMDTEYKIDAFDLSRQFFSVLEVWNEPRRFGLTISYFY